MASINDKQITRTESNIYTPVYDTDTDTYKDRALFISTILLDIIVLVLQCLF